MTYEEYHLWYINVTKISEENINVQENIEMSNTITYYQTRRISDMTEGMGHMINDLAFTKWQDAADYINSQPGVQGRRIKWTEELYAGDWDIQKVNVLNGPYDPSVKVRAAALAKLTPEERKALGFEE